MGRLKREDGTEIAEAALVMPLLFMFLLGIVWFGRAFNIYATITQAAKQGAFVSARYTCASCGNQPATDQAVWDSVHSVLAAASINGDLIPYQPTSLVSCIPDDDYTCDSYKNLTICRNVSLNPVSNAPAICGNVVSFRYPVQVLGSFQSITLTAESRSQMQR